MKDLARQLKAVANERRLKILVLLKKGGMWTVSDIADAIKLSIRSTSRHLQLLKQAGLLEDTQSGACVYYRPCKDHPVYKIVSNLI